MSTYVPNIDNDDIEYTEDDMLDMENIFGTCDIESKLYTICLRDTKTKKHAGWKKYWYPEWTLVKHECKKEAAELELCQLKCDWRTRIVDNACRELSLKYHACSSVVAKVQMTQAASQLSMNDCLEPFAEFMQCARNSIQQREFEQKFKIT